MIEWAGVQLGWTSAYLRQRRGNLEGVSDCGDALRGVGASAILIKATELIVRQIELRGEHMVKEELVKVEAQSEAHDD